MTRFKLNRKTRRDWGFKHTKRMKVARKFKAVLKETV